MTAPPQMPSTLTITHDGPVVRVTLNRPDVRNAFNETLIAELTAWAAGVKHTEARVAILAGAGPVFSAGADLGWMSRMAQASEEVNIEDARGAAAMFEALNTLPIPLVGRVHGAALGGGIGLTAVCDIAVAAEGTVFGFTEARLGIVPAVISPYAVAKIGVSAARELFLTAARFPAARAHELGLVHRVVPDADLDAAVGACVNDLLLGGPEALAGAKALIAQVAGRNPAEVMEVTSRTIARHRVSDEGQEGMAAFREKRKARWA